MNEIILAQDAAESTITGLGAIGYGIATIGPGLGIGILVGKTVEGMHVSRRWLASCVPPCSWVSPSLRPSP